MISENSSVLIYQNKNSFDKEYTSIFNDCQVKIIKTNNATYIKFLK